MTEQQAMRMALEALEKDELHMIPDKEGHMVFVKEKAITALRQALEQQDGDCQRCGGKGCVACDARKQQPADEPAAKPMHPEIKKLYEDFFDKHFAETQREWVGMTDEELKPLCDVNHIIFGAYTIDFVRAIEAKLKEKNT